MDPRRWKWEEDGAEGNIWTQDLESERRMVLRVIFWNQLKGMERRLLSGIFGPKTEEVRGGWC